MGMSAEMEQMRVGRFTAIGMAVSGVVTLLVMVAVICPLVYRSSDSAPGFYNTRIKIGLWGIDYTMTGYGNNQKNSGVRHFLNEQISSAINCHGDHPCEKMANSGRAGFAFSLLAMITEVAVIMMYALKNTIACASVSGVACLFLLLAWSIPVGGMHDYIDADPDRKYYLNASAGLLITSWLLSVIQIGLPFVLINHDKARDKAKEEKEKAEKEKQEAKNDDTDNGPNWGRGTEESSDSSSESEPLPPDVQRLHNEVYNAPAPPKPPKPRRPRQPDPEPEDENEVPRGCTDYKVDEDEGLIVVSSEPDNWRGAGDCVLGEGFELTQDEDEQQGHILCRVPFEVTGSEVHVAFEYMMEPKPADQGGGQGLCVYLVDPSISGWDRQFDGKDSLGFMGKKGAVLGVGLDCAGNWCNGNARSVCIKRATDGKLLCKPAKMDDGVFTGDEDFRPVKVKFDISQSIVRCDVTIGGEKLLNSVPITGVTIPRSLCVGVSARTMDGKSNRMCINDLYIEGEADSDQEGVEVIPASDSDDSDASELDL